MKRFDPSVGWIHPPSGDAPLPPPSSVYHFNRQGSRLNVTRVEDGPAPATSEPVPPAVQRMRDAAAQADPLFSFPAPDPSVFGLDAEDHAWVQRRQTPHPGKPYTHVLNFDAQRVASVPRTFVNCTQPPLATIDISRLRMREPAFWNGAWLPGSQIVEMATGHDPMVSDPKGLTDILLALNPA